MITVATKAEMANTLWFVSSWSKELIRFITQIFKVKK